MSVLVAMCVCTLLLAAAAGALTVDWEDFEWNPVLDPSATPAYYPDVLYSDSGFDGHGDDRPYRMYYDSGGDVWLAYSEDGEAWRISDYTPVITGLRHPQVCYDPSAFGDSAGDPIQSDFPETYTVTPYFKMWAWGPPGDIYFAYSDDGETWHEDYPREVLPSERFPDFPAAPVYDLEVVCEDGSYVGWADNNGELHTCTSSDGTTWTVDSRAIEHGDPGEWDETTHSRASVVKVSDSEWHMWFGGAGKYDGNEHGSGGNMGIGHATSTDGLTWTKDSPNLPIQSLGGYGTFGGLGEPQSWNEDRNYAMSAIYDPDRFSDHGDAALLKMWRSGKNDASGEYAVGLANVDIIEMPIVVEETTRFYRVEGPDRYHTAVEASREGYPAGAEAVIVATGRNWPDALVGASLAGTLDAPILLVDTEVVPPAVSAEIDRLEATDAYILGGPGAVSEAVAAELGEMDLDVTRLGGVDRYETAERVAQETLDVLGAGYDGTAFLATGGDFPDALSAGPLAAAKGWPTYLARPDGNAPVATMQDDEVDTVYVLGGEGVVDSAQYGALVDAFGSAAVDRLWGADRYGTAAAIATFGVDEAGLAWDWLAIATGEDFPDALSGGPLPAKKGSVMLLTRTASLPSQTADVLEARRGSILDVYLLGGPGAVSEAVANELAAILR